MQLEIPRACDVNVSLQRRLDDDMDTCAFTARERGPAAQHVPEHRAGATTAPYYEHRGPGPMSSEEWQQPQPPEGIPTWAVVLALAVALAAVAYLNKKSI